MKKYCLENEKVIKSYIEVKRFKFAESTISQILKAIEKYQEFTSYKDFKQFNFKTVNKYVKYLRDSDLSVSTINGYLTYLRNFLEWLSSQTGYKSRIRLDVVELLSINNNELNQLNKSINKDYPTLEQAKTIFNMVEINNDVDRRDKALIALATLTGMRSESLRTLTLGAIDIQKMEIFQSVKTGVKT
jgi:site-specific recombinase XerD